MDREGSTRLDGARLVLEEQFDNLSRFVRPRWVSYLFMLAYSTMVICLLLVIFILISNLLSNSDESHVKPEKDSILLTLKRPLQPSPPHHLARDSPLHGLLYILALLSGLGIVLCYGHYRWCGHCYHRPGYQQL